MLFTSDTQAALTQTAALVNTLRDDDDFLTDVARLDEFLLQYPMSGTRLRTAAELADVKQMRGRLRGFWSLADRATAAERVNGLLADSATTPYLAKHDGLDWHLHVTQPEAPLAARIGAEAAMGILDLIRTDDLDRLRTCAAPDCDAVLVDLSRNSSRLYCSTGNCGNRANVAAYRARRREQGEPGGMQR